MPLRVHQGLPAGLLDCPAAQLHDRLGGPSLIHLQGNRSPALFVSVLLHGNETSGWDGVRQYLAAQGALDRDLTLFIGNTAAAAEGVRSLPDQADFNRIWRNAVGSGAATAAAVQSAIADQSFFAAVDLHNNTGHNPYYSVITDLSTANLGLAYLFSDRAVFVEEPDTVLTRIFAGRAPAVALEVGPVGDPSCVDRVADYLQRCLSLDMVAPAAVTDFSLFRTRVRVHVQDAVSFRFEGERVPDNGSQLLLTGGIEAVNFHALDGGTLFGSSLLELHRVLRVLDVNHQDVTDTYFERIGDSIFLKQSVVPAMYTTDPEVIRQDCLCYFMERMAF